MTWTTLGKILSQLPHKASWQQRCRLLHIYNYWRDLVGISVAQQSAPEAVVQGVLYVNVSSPVWANALTFERLRLLEKINQHLRQAHLSPIDDIRFSTAKWTSQRNQKMAAKPDLTAHPSWYQIKTQESPQEHSRISLRSKLNNKNNNPNSNLSISSHDQHHHLSHDAPHSLHLSLQTHSGNVPRGDSRQLNQINSAINPIINQQFSVNSANIANHANYATPVSNFNQLSANSQGEPRNETHRDNASINRDSSFAPVAAKPPENALEALERWRKLVKQQEAALVKCPKCQRHCPAGEVQRWQMCRVCATYNLFR